MNCRVHVSSALKPQLPQLGISVSMTSGCTAVLVLAAKYWQPLDSDETVLILVTKVNCMNHGITDTFCMLMKR